MPDDVKAIKEDKFKRDFLDVLNANFKIISECITKEEGRKFERFTRGEKETEELFRNKVIDCLSCMTHNLANITDFLKKNKERIKITGP